MKAWHIDWELVPQQLRQRFHQPGEWFLLTEKEPVVKPFNELLYRDRPLSSLLYFQNLQPDESTMPVKCIPLTIEGHHYDLALDFDCPAGIYPVINHTMYAFSKEACNGISKTYFYEYHTNSLLRLP